MEDVIQVIEFWASIFRLVRAAILAMQAIKLLLDSLANPADDKHRLAVADRLVARAIGTFIGWLAAIWDAGVVAGEALEPFAFARGEAANTCPSLDHWLATPRAVFAGVEALGLQCVGDLASNADRDLAAGIGGAGAVAHCTKRRGEVADICTVILAAEGGQGVFLAAVPAQGEGLTIKDAWILRAMNNEAFNLKVALLALCNKCCRHINRSSSPTSAERGWLDVTG